MSKKNRQNKVNEAPKQGNNNPAPENETPKVGLFAKIGNGIKKGFVTVKEDVVPAVGKALKPVGTGVMIGAGITCGVVVADIAKNVFFGGGMKPLPDEGDDEEYIEEAPAEEETEEDPETEEAPAEEETEETVASGDETETTE